MESDILKKIREKIRKPDKIRKKYYIMSYLISKLSIMYTNIVQTIEIGRLEKSDKKKRKKKEIFKLRSFAHEVKNKEFKRVDF